MLIEFTTKNFRSFKEEATLSMLAESLGNNSKQTFKSNIDENILPLAGVFGPNASGKTNIIKGLAYTKWAVTNTNYLNVPVYSHPLLEPFQLDMESNNQPSYFQAILSSNKSSSQYRYGFEVSKSAVVSEWLEETSKVRKKHTTKLLFTRDEKGVQFHRSIKSNVKQLGERVVPESLALTVLTFSAHPRILDVYSIIKDEVIVYDGQTDLTQQAFQWCYEDDNFKVKLESFLKKADLAIESLALNRSLVDREDFKKMPPQIESVINALGNSSGLVNFQVLTSHKVYDKKGEPLPLHKTFSLIDHESSGTKQLFGFAALVIKSLELGATLAIDEFGNSIHPFINKAILKMFSNLKTNSSKAQLIFCSHDTYLLSSKGANLRRDEVWFTEKDRCEVSSLHSLAEYKTRKDYEIAKNYLEGRFGAVPVTTFEQ